MSVEFRKLKDRIITDTGEVVFKSYPLLEYYALQGRSLKGVKVAADQEVTRYNARNPDEAVIPWTDDGQITGPPPETFEYDIPAEYKKLDLATYMLERFAEKIPSDPEGRYQERLLLELDMMEQRGMFEFLRCLIYIVETFEANDVVQGVGRGSSCASLVMYLIGMHRVDPVLYDIPISEFLK